MAHYHSHKRRTANGRMKMDEIEITYSETEFTLKNGFTLSCPFEVCVVATVIADGGETESANLEAVVGKQGQTVPVCIADFVQLYFDENKGWFEQQAQDQIDDDFGRKADQAYDVVKDHRAMGFEL